MRILSTVEVDELCKSIIDNSISRKDFCSQFFKLLFSTGLRYNDVALSFSTYVSGDYFTVQPSKNNNPRIIPISSIDNIFFQFVSGVDCFYYRISYSTLCRSFVKNCPYGSISVGGKSLFLHLFRHNYMKQLFAKGESLQSIAVITGEKHIASVSNYVFSEIYV